MSLNNIPPEFIRCPDCSGDVVFDVDRYRCKKCQNESQVAGMIHNLLPRELDKCKVGEDSVHSDENLDKAEVIEEPSRFLRDRASFINRFKEEILGKIREGNFLELGGETSWASSLVKLRYPSSTVYASDVSPSALERMGVRISKILESPVDYFVACDAENIPFQDEFFDSIIMISAMHHLPQPGKMLREVQRVLKKGGIFIAVDGAIPKWFRFLFKKEADERAKKHGIIENLISYGEWEKILEEGGMAKSDMAPYTNPKYVEGFVHKTGARILNRLPKGLVKYVFPVGIIIKFTKI